jgi:hypothetical protein
MNAQLHLIGSKIKYSRVNLNNQIISLKQLEYDMLHNKMYQHEKNQDINHHLQAAISQMDSAMMEIRKAIELTED